MSAHETYRVVWYAELGLMDGGARGYWDHTVSSEAFDTKQAAEDYFRKHPQVKVEAFEQYTWTEMMGMARIRRDLVRVDPEEIIGSILSAEKYTPKVVPMGSNPPLFDGMHPDPDGPWVSWVDIAKRLRVALAVQP